MLVLCGRSGAESISTDLLGTLWSWGLIPGLDFGVGSLNVLPSAFLSLVSCRHLRVACSVGLRFRKAKLIRAAALRSLRFGVPDSADTLA